MRKCLTENELQHESGGDSARKSLRDNELGQKKR